MEGRRLIRESGCAGRVSSERTDGRVRMAHMIRGNPCAYHTPHTSRAWREARQVSSVASHVLCDIIQVYNLDNSDLSIRCIVTCNYVAWNTDYGHAEGGVYSMYSTRTVYDHGSSHDHKRFDALDAPPAQDRISPTKTDRLLGSVLPSSTSSPLNKIYVCVCNNQFTAAGITRRSADAHPIIAHRRDRANREPR